VGSRFTVSNIFFNVPARRKFLKSNATELNNILTAFERIVLVYPEISFTLHSNGQELMNLRAGSLRQRITDVYGRRYGQDLLPVSVETAICKITGFVGKPESARKKGAHEYFFVNGRFMKHPYFHKAVQQAYDRLIQIGTHVPYFIYFDVSPADIDVNIHPTKTEIKFENEQAIWQILAAAVKDAIGQFCEIPQIDFDTEGKPDIPVFNPTEPTHVAAPVSHANPQYNPFRQKPSQDWQKLYEALPKETKPAEVPLFDEPPVMEEHLTPQSQSVISDMAPTHYQYKGRYIMTAVKSGLMIIDQHRADIRVRYERYLHQLAEAPAESQRLLFPEVLELSPAEAALVTDLLPALTNLGFELTPLGPASYAVNGIPAGLEGLRPSRLLQELLASPPATVNRDVLSANTQLALSLARHAAIPYGQLLTNDEMDVLVNDLFACENVNYTPDGKNILSILPQRDIEHIIE
jgi:DNA mismatch repair protein MutL